MGKTGRKQGGGDGRAANGTGKDAQLVLRLKKEERDAFVALCRAQDTSAAREIRRFIRGYLREQGG
ncbi:MAG: hypothetical protein ACU0BF_02635 [Paracoccaceae bacterium]